jgi:hypothetical protein
VAAMFVVFLFFAWLGGRPKRKRHLGRGA